MRKLTWALLSLAAMPTDLFAQQAANFAIISPPAPARKYGLAGCGLGSVLLPNGPQVAASIVNSLFWNQVFLISSGTSNCQNDSLRQAGLDQEQYMIANYRNIARDAAQGRGESLEGLAQVLGCRPEDERSFSQFTQRNHQQIFSQPGALAALNSLKTRITTEQQLAKSCQYAGLPSGRAEVR